MFTMSVHLNERVMKVLHYLSYRSDGAFMLIGELNAPRLLVFVCKQPAIRIQSLQSYVESFVRIFFLFINPLAYTDVPETAGLARSINP